MWLGSCGSLELIQDSEFCVCCRVVSIYKKTLRGGSRQHGGLELVKAVAGCIGEAGLCLVVSSKDVGMCVRILV